MTMILILKLLNTFFFLSYTVFSVFFQCIKLGHIYKLPKTKSANLVVYASCIKTNSIKRNIELLYLLNFEYLM